METRVAGQYLPRIRQTTQRSTKRISANKSVMGGQAILKVTLERPETDRKHDLGKALKSRVVTLKTGRPEYNKESNRIRIRDRGDRAFLKGVTRKSSGFAVFRSELCPHTLPI